MKKILSFILVTLLVLGLSACGKKDKTIVGEWKLHSIKEGNEEILVEKMAEKIFSELIGSTGEEIPEEAKAFFKGIEKILGGIGLVVDSDYNVSLSGADELIALTGIEEEIPKGTVREENGKYIFEFENSSSIGTATIKEDGKLYFDEENNSDITTIFIRKK